MTDEQEGEARPPRRIVQDTAERERRLRWERQIRNDIDDLRRVVDDFANAPLPDAAPANLADVVAGLVDDVAKLQDAAAKTPLPFHWDYIHDQGERARREHDLQRWVDEVLVPWHPRQARGILSCWFEHLPSRQDMTFGWLAWVGACVAKGRKHSEPAHWRRVELPSMVAQIVEDIGSAAEGCEEHPEATGLRAKALD